MQRELIVSKDKSLRRVDCTHVGITVNQDVIRLDIAVRDAFRVEVGQGGDQLREHLVCDVEGHRAMMGEIVSQRVPTGRSRDWLFRDRIQVLPGIPK